MGRMSNRKQLSTHHVFILKCNLNQQLSQVGMLLFAKVIYKDEGLIRHHTCPILSLTASLSTWLTGCKTVVKALHQHYVSKLTP